MIRKGRIALAVVVVCAVVVGIEAFRVMSWPRAKPTEEARAKEYVRQMKLQREILASWRKQDLEGDIRSPFYFVWAAGMFKQFAMKHLGSLKDLNIVEDRAG